MLSGASVVNPFFGLSRTRMEQSESGAAFAESEAGPRRKKSLLESLGDIFD